MFLFQNRFFSNKFIGLIICATALFWSDLLMAENNIPQSLEKFLKEKGFANPGEVWSRDWTKPVGIIEAKKVIWVVDSDDGKSLVVVSFDGENWHSFNNPANLGLVNRGLRMPGPEARNPEYKFQHMLIAILHDPRILICGSWYIEQSEDVLEAYVRTDENDVNLLRDICKKDPEFQLRSSDWSSTVRIMDYTGTIKDVKMTGRLNPLTISGFSITDISAKGDFFFADLF